MSCRYNAIKDFDINQSKGVSVSLWWQGCEHRCEGCFSPHTWNFEEGEEFTEETIKYIVYLLTKDSIKKNLSILGGETLSPNKLEMLEKLLREVRAKVPNAEVWLWTGYLYENVCNLEVIKLVDVVIDGKYNIEQHDPTRYKGSKNQRVISVKESINSGEIVLYE